jgi:Flp pilus assembly protein TadD
LKKYNDSLAAYDKSIELNPDDADTWNSRGNALRDIGRNEEAEAAFAKAKVLGYTD